MGTSDALERRTLYKNYAIVATSYTQAGGWIPRAEVDDSRGAGTGAQSLAWKGTHSFPTRQLADERALQMGRRWVDDRG